MPDRRTRHSLAVWREGIAVVGGHQGDFEFLMETYRFSFETGKFENLGNLIEAVDNTSLATHNNGNLLYAFGGRQKKAHNAIRDMDNSFFQFQNNKKKDTWQC